MIVVAVYFLFFFLCCVVVAPYYYIVAYSGLHISKKTNKQATLPASHCPQNVSPSVKSILLQAAICLVLPSGLRDVQCGPNEDEEIPDLDFAEACNFFFFLSNSCRLLHSSRLRNRSTRLQCVISQAECLFHIVCLRATFRRSRLEWLIAQWDSLSWQWLKSLLNNTEVKASGKTDQHSLSQTFVTFACSDLFRSCHILLRDEGDDVDKSIKMILNTVRIFKAERLVKWIAFVSPAVSSWQ